MGSAYLSVVVDYVPAIAVAIWIRTYLRKGTRDLFITIGPALFIFGLCTYIGAKYYSLPVIARSGHLQGKGAIDAGIIFASAGVVMTGMHFLLLRIFPKWMLVRKAKKG